MERAMAQAQTCSRCSKVNPSDAVYCYFDGAILGGGNGAQGGPVNIGAQAFPTPFVFPTGQKCLNFDQLALTCQNNWKAALDVLSQGYLESFLGGMGRVDLAGAAKEAARFPDRDRGLDQFLAKLPSDVVKPPILGVEPTEINLGTVKAGEDRTIDLRLDNKGMRLIYGSVASDSVWLAVGDKGNANQKLFQFGDTLTIPVKIRGKHVQARNKVQQGKLTVDTNAGKVEVTVKMDVPVKAYPGGLFGGAKSPRQVAETVNANQKNKDKMKEAATAFESGDVAKWYKENNWTYPIQGPTASGMGAVQQYFEALGMMAPPKVKISERSLTLRGNVGGTLTHQLELTTDEKRPIYGHGVSDQGWLEVKRAQLTGRTATIPISVKIPDRPGETVKANITIKSNGNQRFIVPVSLAIGGTPRVAAAAAAAGGGFDFGVQTSPSAGGANPFAAAAGGGGPTAPLVTVARHQRGGVMHLIPAALLFLALGGVFAVDMLIKSGILKGGSISDVMGSTGPPSGLTGGSDDDLKIDYDPVPKIAVSFNERQRFGIVMLEEKDPTNPDKYKKLMYMEDGSYNNTCVKVDGDEHLYGQAPGDWGKDDKTRKRLNGVEMIRGRKWVSAWEYPGRIRVVQTVMIVPNDDTKKLDTALVHYLVQNRDNKPHQVGLRIMIDTYIGAEDGVPFAIPGQADLLTTKRDFRNTKEIPDFIQALERPNLEDPGTTATMVLKFPQDFRLSSNDPQLDPIVRMVISRFPGNPEVRWDYTKDSFWDMNDKTKGERNDSCVALYWEDRKMAASEKRAFAFSYGLGKISGDGMKKGSKLALTYNPKPTAGSEFTVTAWLKNPDQGQQVHLEIPKEFSFVEPSSEMQQVSKGKSELAQVSWRLKVAKDCKPSIYKITAHSAGAKATADVPVRKKFDNTIFGGN
jgi:hypothetical protein